MESEMLEVFAMDDDEKAARAKRRVLGIGGPSLVYPTVHSQERVGRTHLKKVTHRGDGAEDRALSIAWTCL